jgi:hypothetical protein
MGGATMDIILSVEATPTPTNPTNITDLVPGVDNTAAVNAILHTLDVLIVPPSETARECKDGGVPVECPDIMQVFNNEMKCWNENPEGSGNYDAVDCPDEVDPIMLPIGFSANTSPTVNALVTQLDVLSATTGVDPQPVTCWMQGIAIECPQSVTLTPNGKYCKDANGAETPCPDKITNP